MDHLETNVAKITLGNVKQTSSYVVTMAEKAAAGDCELFAVVSLPVLNPAAVSDCERISEALLATLKRAFRQNCDEASFETALGQINEELGKLNSLGEQNWTGKISALVAARKNTTLYVAATGKTSALLIRNGEATEIVELSEGKHPLKTFDTFSNGKLKAQDIIILTTKELFNHLSLDRIKKILENNTLEIGAQEILQLLEDNAGPEVAFGTLLIQEVPAESENNSPGLTATTFNNEPEKITEKLTKNAKQFLNKETAANIWKSLQKAAQKPKVSVDKLGKLAEFGGQGLGFLKEKAKGYKNFDYRAPIQNFKTASRPKQFFIVSILVLVLAISTNIIFSRQRKEATTKQQVFTQAIASVESLANDAESKLLFKDTAAALELLSEAESKLTQINTDLPDQQQTLSQTRSRLDGLKNKILNITPATIQTLGSLSSSNHLISLPGIFATATGQTLVSFDIATGEISDGKLKSNSEILNSTSLDSLRTIIFDGQGLRVWTPGSGETGDPFYQNLPKPSFLVALDKYETNGRVYILDTEKGQVTSFQVSETTISKPQVSVANPILVNAYDIAIDGSVYALTTNGVVKFTAGKQVPFSTPTLTPPLNPAGKIHTAPKIKNVYLLDPTGRIIITDKKGTLIKILASEQLKGAQDFYVDEAGGVVYVLNSGTLLKVNLN